MSERTQEQEVAWAAYQILGAAWGIYGTKEQQRIMEWFYAKAWRLPEQPSGRNPFWTAVSWWCRQGKRVGQDGYCLWEVPTQKVYRVGARTYLSEPLYLKLRAEGKVQEIAPTIAEERL